MWLRSKSIYTDEDLEIIYSALLNYKIILKAQSCIDDKLEEVLKKIYDECGKNRDEHYIFH